MWEGTSIKLIDQTKAGYKLNKPCTAFALPVEELVRHKLPHLHKTVLSTIHSMHTVSDKCRLDGAARVLHTLLPESPSHHEVQDS